MIRKKLYRSFAALTVTLLVCVLSFQVARAAESTFTLPKDQTYDGLLAKASEKIVIEGTVNGDLWVAGSDVDIAGVVRGSVYAAGSTVRVRGQIDGNVHALGSSVSVDRTVRGSTYVAGSVVKIEESAEIERATAIAGSELMIKGNLRDRLYAAGSSIVVAGQVGRDVRLAGSDIVLEGAARINGDLRYVSQLDATIPNDKAISGRIIRDTPPDEQRSQDWRQRVYDTLIGLLMSIATAAIVLALWGDELVKRAQLFRQLPIRVFGRGVFFTVLVPIVSILLAITLIGLPIGIILALLYVVILLVAPTASGLLIGLQITQAVHESGKPLSYVSKLQTTVLGLLVLAIVGFLPVLGPAISLFAFLAGVGVIIASHVTDARKS